MKIHLLDMGQKRYGDCLVAVHGGRTLLIDGAQPGNSNDILTQLKRVLKKDKTPIQVDLLVITHCHDDHIGYLPELVENGEIRAKTVLAIDEKLGWGRDMNGRSPVDDKGLSDLQKAMVAALLEEDHAGLPDAELERFIQDAAALEERYSRMLKNLKKQGATVVRYGRHKTADIQKIEREFSGFGLKILGAAVDQIVVCAEAIARQTDSIADAVATDLAADAGPSALVRVYRQLTRRLADDAEFAADKPGVGAAKNNQGIVLKVAAGGWSGLLTGDMQSAKPEVPGLSGMMKDLRRKIADDGPYDFIKLGHHTSDNALDDSVLKEYGRTRLFAHSGGLNDANHPDEEALKVLEAGHEQKKLDFGRTDRNGLITVERKQGGVKMTPDKKELNDFSVNRLRDEPVSPETRRREIEGSPSPRVTTETLKDHGTVEVVARIPNRTTRVTLTIQVEPGQETGVRTEVEDPGAEAHPGMAVPVDVPELRLAGGRPLPRLLFVTCRTRLEANIGKMETARVFKALSGARNVRILDLPGAPATAEQAADKVRAGLAAEKYTGVVILGGYDVVPAHRLDVLDAGSRSALEAAGQDDDDADHFIVWSDDIYGDTDGDFIPELPVSRIPDGRRADVVFNALAAANPSSGRRFGVRNIHRPFAEPIFQELPGGGGRLEVSETFGPEKVVTGSPAGAVYFMLHGSARDATRFWGETKGGSVFEAFAVENVPEAAAGSVVFSGCCWGALAMSPAAASIRPETPLRPRSPESSVAVSYLRAGALAFVGCTGSHYSPVKAPYDYFGKPLHESFWAEIRKGAPPAEALFQAKKSFAQRMPHGRTDPFSRAVEVKLLRQFTCLGLGW